jgi:hypothetical protein
MTGAPYAPVVLSYAEQRLDMRDAGGQLKVAFGCRHEVLQRPGRVPGRLRRTAF